MIKLTDEMRQHVDSALASRYPCILATSSKIGEPGVGFRGSVMIFDDDHVAFWERGRRGQMEQMEENPKVAVIFRNHELGLGWRFYGEATIHGEGDPLREQIWERVVPAEQERDPEKQGWGVLIRVDVVRDVNAPVLQTRD
jgi:predicted pyridoxine 5'-phosphate oxidase superfamily flavin-nucleotide-binding protein